MPLMFFFVFMFSVVIVIINYKFCSRAGETFLKNIGNVQPIKAFSRVARQQATAFFDTRRRVRWRKSN